MLFLGSRICESLVGDLYACLGQASTLRPFALSPMWAE